MLLHLVKISSGFTLTNVETKAQTVTQHMEMSKWDLRRLQIQLVCRLLTFNSDDWAALVISQCSCHYYPKKHNSPLNIFSP